MKHNLKQFAGAAVFVLAIAFSLDAQPKRGRPAPPRPAPSGVYQTVSGSIAQFNYNRDGLIEGFLLNNNTLVHLPPAAAGFIGSSLRQGDTIEVAGLANSNPSGLTTIAAQHLTDRTSGKTISIPQPGAAAPYSGSGRIQQLNYAADGAVNGFLLDNGTLIEMPPFSAANPSSIRVGGSVSFTGYARSSISGRTVVNAQTLTVNGQSLALAGPAPRAAVPPPAPAAPPAPPPTATEEPAPPPPPPQN
ncbi:MAG TPA: hypothetical protein VKX25_18165 [Bryobacteraceae bacterium]|jgi:hypothetical protein|nr:hypothetical protein [Bryobacteraceae bacterium]